MPCPHTPCLISHQPPRFLFLDPFKEYRRVNSVEAELSYSLPPSALTMSTSEASMAGSSTSTPAMGQKPSIPYPKKHPCVLCQQRKVKCDRNDPCSNCVKARTECVQPSTDLPRKRKRRFPETELLARLRKYEEYFKENGLDLDAVNHDAVSPKSERSLAKDNTPLEHARPMLSVRRSLRGVEK